MLALMSAPSETRHGRPRIKSGLDPGLDPGLTRQYATSAFESPAARELRRGVRVPTGRARR
jgi:hypothetical protein